jgi:two-component system sensor histidine kinase MprB
MTFRTRLTLAATTAVAVAVVTASAVIFVLVRQELRDEVDFRLGQLSRIVQVAVEPDQGQAVTLPAPELGTAPGYAEVVSAQPSPAVIPNVLPDTERDLQIAAGTAPPAYRDANVGGVHVRILTFGATPGIAVQLARSLEEIDNVLGGLAIVLGVVSAVGVFVAAALGWVVSRAALRPVRGLTEATEHIAETLDLTRRIEAGGTDELARLGASFNAMLEALDRSLRSQRQLVADASHELRTPLTSLRTNIELLASGKRLPAEERMRLLDDVVAQLEELSILVGDVVELARDGQRHAEVEDVRLDQVVGRAVERARTHAPEVRFETGLEPCVVRGVPARLDRAVANLLDNAVKWSRARGPIEVEVHDGEVSVRDHGPGIDQADLPHVFDRFYRATSARGLPGSGLGLAIVKQVAEAHGGVVAAERADGGGALLRLRLPVANS